MKREKVIKKANEMALDLMTACGSAVDSPEGSETLELSITLIRRIANLLDHLVTLKDK